MALNSLSSPGLSLSLCLRSEPTHLFKLSPKSFPTLATKCRRNPIMNIKATATTSVEGITRRTGNHHGNLWDDDFIQSLPKLPYNAPYYRQRADRLVGEVKEMFNAMGSADSSSQTVYKRLELVDKVERLGIGRHFEKEIEETLDYVYRFWNDISSKDLNTAALGLRILRLHRYPVSADVLEKFKGKDGKFLRCPTQSEEEIKSIVSLFQVSLIAFPEETIMDEAKDFSTMYLSQILQKAPTSSANLLQEISHNLEYGWHTNLPRLEARNYMDIYGENSSWLKNEDNQKILYLAKLDFNIMQSLYREDLQIICRWWKESQLSKLECCRHRHVEYIFSGCAIAAEPKYSAFRIALAKFCTLGTIIDDFYDTYGTVDELELFTDTFKRWDSPPVDHLPKYMKIAYHAVYDAINESVQEALKIQDRDTLHHVRNAWDSYLDSMLQEAKWLATRHIPNLSMYLKNRIESVGSRTATMQAILTVEKISEDDLQKINYPSRFNELLRLTLGLRGDIRTFKAEAARGEIASSITCYMRDHPESSEEDALKSINFMLDAHMKELNMEILKNDEIPTCIKDFSYNTLRGFLLFYKERDGFSISSKDMRIHVKKILIDPIKM